MTATVESSTNIDVLYGRMYGIRNTHEPTRLQINSLFNDDSEQTFALSAKSGPNVMQVMSVESYNQQTGLFIFSEADTDEYGGYFNYAITGTPGVLTQCPYPCYTFDVANEVMLYKPASGDPSNAYIPNMGTLLRIGGVSSAIEPVPTFKVTNMHFYSGHDGAVIASNGSVSSAPGQLQTNSKEVKLVVDESSFRYSTQAIRTDGAYPTHLKRSIISDMAVRGMTTLSPGATVERCIFDTTQASSALFGTYSALHRLGEPRRDGLGVTQGRITITDNVFQLPTTNHGQSHSLYEGSYLNALIEHNIYYNCQRTSSAQLGTMETTGAPVGQTYEFSNNLSIMNNFPDNQDSDGQAGLVCQSGDDNSDMDNGELKMLFRSNTVFIDNRTANPNGETLWKQGRASFGKDVKADVKWLNNFIFHGIGPSDRTLDELKGDGIAHGFANNYTDGYSIDGTNSSALAHGSSDVRLPAGITIGEVFDGKACTVVGSLGTAATDGSKVGIRWNPIPTTTQIEEIIYTGNVNWADTYPAQSIPSSPNSHNPEISGDYSRAFSNEDNRPNSLISYKEQGISIPVKVIRTGTSESIFKSLPRRKDFQTIFELNENPNPSLRLIKGTTYTFDQSHRSNRNYPLEIGRAEDGASGGFTSGFSYSGTPGKDGIATFVPPQDSPNNLFYFSPSLDGMGGIIGVTSS